MRWKRTSIIGWAAFVIYAVTFLAVISHLASCSSHPVGPTDAQEEIMVEMDKARASLRRTCEARLWGERKYIACPSDLSLDCTYEYCDARARSIVLIGRDKEIHKFYRRRP